MNALQLVILFLIVVLVVAIIVTIVKIFSNDKSQYQQQQDLSETLVFCPKCGKQFLSGAQFCNVCGSSIISYDVENPYNPADARSGGYAVLCFLFPVIGLILYLVWRDQYPLRAKSCGKGALISVILYFAMYFGVFGLLT